MRGIAHADFSSSPLLKWPVLCTSSACRAFVPISWLVFIACVPSSFDPEGGLHWPARQIPSRGNLFPSVPYFLSIPVPRRVNTWHATNVLNPDFFSRSSGPQRWLLRLDFELGRWNCISRRIHISTWPYWVNCLLKIVVRQWRWIYVCINVKIWYKFPKKKSCITFYEKKKICIWSFEDWSPRRVNKDGKIKICDAVWCDQSYTSLRAEETNPSIDCLSLSHQTKKFWLHSFQNSCKNPEIRRSPSPHKCLKVVSRMPKRKSQTIWHTGRFFLELWRRIWTMMG